MISNILILEVLIWVSLKKFCFLFVYQLFLWYQVLYLVKILIIIQAYFITNIYYNYKDSPEGKKLFILLIVNGIFNILYTPVFFKLKSLFGGFAISLLVLVSLMLIVMKSKQIKVKEWYLELPYLLWSVFALILSITIYFMN